MEIKFRGKPLMDLYEDFTDECIFDTDKFVYGNLICSGNERYIVGEVVEASEDYIILEWWTPVNPATVGQYTGLKDKNGVEIYEGDIVLSKSWQKHLVEYNVDFLGFATHILDTSHKGQTFPLTSQITYNDKHGIQSMHVEVVGNKWDNPELLEATP